MSRLFTAQVTAAAAPSCPLDSPCFPTGFPFSTNNPRMLGAMKEKKVLSFSNGPITKDEFKKLCVAP